MHLQTVIQFRQNIRIYNIVLSYRRDKFTSRHTERQRVRKSLPEVIQCLHHEMP